MHSLFIASTFLAMLFSPCIVALRVMTTIG